MVLIPLSQGEMPLSTTNYGALIGTTIVTFAIWQLSNRRSNQQSDTSVGANSSANLRENQDAVDRSQFSVLPADWALAFRRKGYDNASIDRLLTIAYESGAAGAITLPNRGTVFRAFHETPISKVRAVILGMDPYPQLGRATGLAFSVPYTETDLPQSLKRIFANMESDPALDFHAPRSGDLSRWGTNGVLLLNGALTVQEGVPGSHLSLWRDFVRTALEIVQEQDSPVAFMLWGDKANELTQGLLESNHRQLVLRATHPVKESASRFQRFSESRHFSEANKFLESHGVSPIRWSL